MIDENKPEIDENKPEITEGKSMIDENKPESININGIEYLPKDSYLFKSAERLDDMIYVIIRTYSAGVHAGYLKSRTGKEVELVNSRRIWSWDGAATLSQLSVDGTSKPSECKFPCELQKIILTEAIEIIPCSEKSRISIKGVPIWSS